MKTHTKIGGVIGRAIAHIAKNDGRDTTITRCGGGRAANYLVRHKSGTSRQLDDGTYWDGWETVGHYAKAADAAASAIEAAQCCRAN